ncbi:glycosyltransferase [Gillisia sp. M10.2A]|uniref:Glycosyltransferase n=1 Tax=Gillisia lutea TaxID=2909668 RepID=A0ABS9EII3_9FLAO|nr:glycosyltransferase [Gillisia lutea]MCF4102672.1 glycosyltransferase [Gillisia lutea]
MLKTRFAAFVMTFERPDVLVETIKKIQSQSFPPAVVLIVDNSNNYTTQERLQKENLIGIEYLRVGYNSGPAGAAYLALKHLTNLGFEWIYWGDDDNPPRDTTVFANLMGAMEKLTSQGIKLGLLGEKGGKFNSFSGRIKSLSNFELKQGEYLEVDSIPGGHSMIVNTEVIKNKIFPNSDLFFGFEEFDFCLNIKKSSFKLMITTAPWLKVREENNLSNKEYRWRGNSFGKSDQLQREYYSTRNLLDIFYKHHYYIPFVILLIKSFGKMLLGFKYGTHYGRNMFLIQSHAITDFFKGNFGMKKHINRL